MQPDAAAVIDFWFGPERADVPREAWFRKDPAFDALIGARFGAQVDAALAGGLRDWDAQPLGALARVLLLDQFTRNLFRDTPRAFAGDALALAAAQAMVARADDRRLNGVQRWFAYLPYEHAEDGEVQRTSLALFSALAAEHPAQASALEWAEKHAEVVWRFGRYPHRNAILGRESTPAEIEFLRQPGSRF
jgi:uncharacterized protein (DUF924 family)